MIKLKSLLTENRLRDLERSEVAHVNKAFERLVKSIDNSRILSKEKIFSIMIVIT